MHYQEFYYWCRDAVKKIKYIPDRNKVYAELYSHMQDRYDAFIERGLSPKDAEKKTLETMGNADELAVQLAAIHKPFWGYALVFTRIVAILMLLVTLGSGIYYFHEQKIQNEKDEIEHIVSGGLLGEGAHSMLYGVKPEVKKTCDGYIFCVTDAQLWRSHIREEVNGNAYYDRLFLRLEVSNLLPWAPEQQAMDAMWAVDSAGVYHDTIIRETTQPGMGYIGVVRKQRVLNTYCYDLYFSNTPEDVEWVELHYDRDGRDLVLRVELTGGAGK